MVKNPPANAGEVRDAGLIPGSGKSPEGGNGNSLQYFCLENPMDRGAWWATVQGVPKSGIRLSKHVYPLINAALLSVFEPGTASTPLIRTNPLEEGVATRSSILAWKIPWTEESGGLPSIGLQNWTQLK